MPKVTIIIPTFNRADFVVEAIHSVLGQTVKDFEVIVVNDGSVDQTEDVVTAIRDDRLRYFRTENTGISAARNYGLKKASGEYVALLDHDDLWPENFLEVMISALEKNTDYGLAYCPITLSWPNGRRQKSYKTDGCRSGWVTRDLFKTGFVWTSAALIRKNVLMDMWYDDQLRKSYEDGDFFLILSVRTKYLLVCEVEAIKRIHDSNYSAEVGMQPTRILVLERFYYQHGGDEFVPKKYAMRKLSHACRSVAKANYQNGNRKAALTLYKRAIKYYWRDLRLYCEFLRALMLDQEMDPEPQWEMPDMLEAKPPKV